MLINKGNIKKQKMKNSILKIALVAFICSATISVVSAQKFAHINSQQLLLEMPAVKTADAEIQSYQATLIKKGEDMVKAFEAKYVAYADQANKGELNKIQMQQKEGELSKEQQAIQNYEVEVQNLLGQKRQTLYKPIIDKVQAAIEAVGKEGNYTMVFDSGSGVLVHADEGEDIMAKVKTKLGI